MSIAYLDGQFLPAHEARVSPFDRGFLFGDGVYEGLRAFSGRVRALDEHLQRMRRGLLEARIDFDTSRLAPLTNELLARNNLQDSFIYWQVTRGAPGPQDPIRERIPSRPLEPTVFGMPVPMPGLDSYREPMTCTGALVEDLRWKRGHVKSVSLLGNVLGAMEARDAGAVEAIMHADGLVSESCASNVLVAFPDRRIATPDLESTSILDGMTRRTILDIEPAIDVRPVMVDELRQVSEIMLCGTTAMVTSVVKLDGVTIGDGTPGPVARTLLDRFVATIRSEVGAAA